jgi:type I restriction enzyme, R subunit
MNFGRGNERHRGLDDDSLVAKLLTPSFIGDKIPRYYQEIAINEALKAILQGQKRILLTMATGTGKTLVAFQICWTISSDTHGVK